MKVILRYVDYNNSAQAMDSNEYLAHSRAQARWCLS